MLVDGIGLPQSLRWHDGALWFSDQFADTVHRLVDGRLDTVARVRAPGGLGFLADGRLLVVSTAEDRVYRQEPDGALAVHADLSGRVGGPLNDLVTDPQGRAWVGGYGFDFDRATASEPFSALYRPPGPPLTSLLRIDPDGGVHDTGWPVMFPNGCCWSPEGDRLLLCETLRFAVSSFPVGEGAILGRPQDWARLVDGRLWAALTAGGVLGAATRWVSALLDHPSVSRFSSSPIAPEAVAAEPDGSVWVANALRSETVRLAPGGRVLERIRTSGHTLGVTLGGPTGRSLHVGTVPTLDPIASRASFAGRIEVLDLDPSPQERP